MKAEHISIALTLVQVPNIDEEIAALLHDAGVTLPAELADADPHWLYDKICQITRKTHDRRLLFVLQAAVDFARGNAPKHWTEFRAAPTGDR